MTERLEEGFRADLGTVADIADLDGHHVVVDYPTSDDVIDSYRTSWSPGVFDESLRANLPPLCFNHDPNTVIGRATKWENLGNRTRIVSRFASFDEVPKAREAHSLIRDGIMSTFSFHFRDASSVAHPHTRGARKFVKARLMETSPVTFGSIPGAVAVGIRSMEAPALEVPTIEEIIRLRDLHVIDEEGVRALIAEHHPHLRDHLRVVTVSAGPTPAEKAAELLADSGLRDMVIRIGSDGSVSTSDPEGNETAAGDDDDDPATLASAVDAALDEACRLLDAVDTTSLPDTVQQAVALVQAAGVAVDELLDVMGLADPDEDGQVDDTGDRAAMSAADEKKLSDDDFAYIDSKGGRHLPIQDPPHVRNALARFDQTTFESDDAKAKAKAKIEAAAKRFGIDTAGKRSDEPGPEADGRLDADLDRVLEKLNRR